MKTTNHSIFNRGKYLIFLMLLYCSPFLNANNFSNNTITIDENFTTGNLSNIIISIQPDCSEIIYLDIQTGTVNDDDIYWIRDNLTELNGLTIRQDGKVLNNTLPENAFLNHKNIHSFYFKNLNTIGNSAFRGCTKFSGISSTQLTHIGDSTFAGCSYLWELEMNTPIPPEVGDGAFEGCHYYRQFRLPYEGKIACQAVDDGNTKDNYWYGFELIVPFEDQVTIDYTFTTGQLSKSVASYRSDLTAITKLTIIEGILNNSDVYWIRDSLPNIEILRIEENASFTGGVLPDNALKNHKTLQTAYIPTAIFIGDNAFEGCLNLITVFATSATSLSNYAFKGCSNLNDLFLNKQTPPSVGEGTFEGCTSEGRIVDLNSQSNTGAYLAVDDGNTNDEFWYGWEIQGSGSVVIQVNTDEGGNIDWGVPSAWDTIYENVNGALFWNGEDWVANDTYGHMYFEDLRTFERVGNYGGINYLIPAETTIGIGRIICDYVISVDEYTYNTTANDSGIYTYRGLKYSILQPDGTTIKLYSRGNGNGTDRAYFDVVVEDNSPGPGITTFREGGVISDATGYSLEEAIEKPIVDSLVRGRLVTSDLTHYGYRYFIDTNGGNEMGGMSYILETTFLPPPNTVEAYNTAQTYISKFSVNFKNAKGELESFIMVPSLSSESYTPPVADAISSIIKSNNDKLILYPNPAINILNIKNNYELNSATLLIYDTNGKLRISRKELSGSSIDISGFTPGLYFMVLHNSGKIYSARFVKQ